MLGNFSVAGRPALSQERRSPMGLGSTYVEIILPNRLTIRFIKFALNLRYRASLLLKRTIAGSTGQKFTTLGIHTVLES
jgi:hypothetical protein